MGWPRLVHSSWGFRLSWAWFGESICLLGCALLKLRTSLLGLSVPLVQLLYGRSGPVRCPWQILQLYSICWMVWLACHIVWARFRMMRRYLACRPDEVPRIFRMLDLRAHGAEGHGPVHLLLTSAAEIGFAWDGGEQGWVRAALPPLWMLSGLVQHFHSAVLEAWQRVREKGRRGGFGVHNSWISEDLHIYLTLPPEGKR